MPDVSMSYSSLETAARQVNTAKTNLENVISNLTSAVGALEGSWEGESYSAFVNAWNESKPTMQKLSEAVGNFAPALNSAVAAQQETDTSLSGTMKTLAF